MSVRVVHSKPFIVCTLRDNSRAFPKKGKQSKVTASARLGHVNAVPPPPQQLLESFHLGFHCPLAAATPPAAPCPPFHSIAKAVTRVGAATTAAFRSANVHGHAPNRAGHHLVLPLLFRLLACLLSSCCLSCASSTAVQWLHGRVRTCILLLLVETCCCLANFGCAEKLCQSDGTVVPKTAWAGYGERTDLDWWKLSVTRIPQAFWRGFLNAPSLLLSTREYS